MSFLLNPFVFAAAGDFESIATVTVGAGGAANIEFTSIPGTYQHLQVRVVSRSTYAANDSYITAQMNGITSAQYAAHLLYGDGASAAATGTASQTAAWLGYMSANNASANIFGATIFDVLDYASTSKATTMRYLAGTDLNGGGQLRVGSGLWTATSAVTSIKLMDGNGGNFAQYSTAALYGIKA